MDEQVPKQLLEQVTGPEPSSPSSSPSTVNSPSTPPVRESRASRATVDGWPASHDTADRTDGRGSIVGYLALDRSSWDAELTAAYERAHAHAALAAALLVLRAVDGWAERERQLRDEIAQEILARLRRLDISRGDNTRRAAYREAAQIVRGGSHE